MISVNPWPLICFSLLIQMGVGYFIISEFACLALSRRFSSEGLRLLRLLSRSLVLVLSVLAVAISFFHVGKPWRALNIINNLESSWLSWEILFLLIFIFLLAAGTILEWQKARGQKFQQILFLLGGLSGLLVVVAMFRLYMLPTVPVWNHFATPSIFLLVCFLLGSQLTAACWTLYLDKSKSPFLPEIRTHWNQETLQRVQNLSLVLVIFIVLVVTLLFPHNNSVVGLVRTLLSLCGTIILGRGWMPFMSFRTKKQISHGYVYFVFIVLFLAEVLGRFLFFAVYSRSGI